MFFNIYVIFGCYITSKNKFIYGYYMLNNNEISSNLEKWGLYSDSISRYRNIVKYKKIVGDESQDSIFSMDIHEKFSSSFNKIPNFFNRSLTLLKAIETLGNTNCFPRVNINYKKNLIEKEIEVNTAIIEFVHKFAPSVNKMDLMNGSVVKIRLTANELGNVLKDLAIKVDPKRTAHDKFIIQTGLFNSINFEYKKVVDTENFNRNEYELTFQFQNLKSNYNSFFLYDYYKVKAFLIVGINAALLNITWPYFAAYLVWNASTTLIWGTNHYLDLANIIQRAGENIYQMAENVSVGQFGISKYTVSNPLETDSPAIKEMKQAAEKIQSVIKVYNAQKELEELRAAKSARVANSPVVDRVDGAAADLAINKLLPPLLGLASATSTLVSAISILAYPLYDMGTKIVNKFSSTVTTTYNVERDIYSPDVIKWFDLPTVYFLHDTPDYIIKQANIEYEQYCASLKREPR